MNYFSNKKNFVITVALGVTVILFMSSCRKEKTDTIPNFEDRAFVPGMRADSVTTLISDSGRLRYKVMAMEFKVLDKLSDPYWYFPKKIYFESLSDTLTVESIVKSDTAYYYYNRKMWVLKNNVLVKNVNGDQFETSLMYWDQNTHKVYSDSFIRIKQQDFIIEGYGFESNESMTKWNVFNNSGIIPLDMESE